MGLSLLAVQGNLHECFGTTSRGGLFVTTGIFINIKIMKISIQGVLKVIVLLVLAVVTGWIFFWVLFVIMFIAVLAGHLYAFFNPTPTRESKIKAVRDLLKE